MSEFKGTKGKWVYDDVHVILLENDKAVQIIATNPSPYSEYRETWEANALLISKGPEMLQMLEEIKGDLLIAENMDAYNKVEQLIKEATEL